MLVSEFFRNKAFGLLNTLGLKKTDQIVRELTSFEQAGKPVQKVNESLLNLLRIVHQQVPFYKSFEHNYDLSAYPVIRKKDLKADYSQFRAPAHLYPEQIKVHTSGSYGTPVDYILNNAKKNRKTSEVLFFGAKAGYFVGRKHGLFMSEPKKSKYVYWLQNEVFFASKVLGQDFLRESRAKLKRGKISILIGFPSAISLLAQYCLDHGDKPSEFKVKGVIACSENLDEQKRKLIERAFGCVVHNRYSTEEFGVLAYQQSDAEGYQINNMHYVVEVLALNEDKPVGVGEIGRVVVTDLFNYAMPLIRFETGDLAVLKEVYKENPSWAKSFSKFSGRLVQILYDTKGNKLFPLYLDIILEKHPYFSQYQLIQESERNYTFLGVQLSKNNFGKELEDLLIADFKAWLGEDANFSIKYVNKIETLPSGKRPYVINRYLPYV